MGDFIYNRVIVKKVQKNARKDISLQVLAIESDFSKQIINFLLKKVGFKKSFTLSFCAFFFTICNVPTAYIMIYAKIK